jgi:hypothetical protein
MICPTSEFAPVTWCRRSAHIFVPEMLEKFQLAVCALRQDWGAERLHDLLDSHGLAGELILGRAVLMLMYVSATVGFRHTRRDQRLPCLRAAGQCTCTKSVPPTITMWGIAAPARDFERRAEDLGAHELSHGRLCL